MGGLMQVGGRAQLCLGPLQRPPQLRILEVLGPLDAVNEDGAL
jgi:hypothetical protein